MFPCIVLCLLIVGCSYIYYNLIYVNYNIPGLIAERDVTKEKENYDRFKTRWKEEVTQEEVSHLEPPTPNSVNVSLSSPPVNCSDNWSWSACSSISKSNQLHRLTTLHYSLLGLFPVVTWITLIFQHFSTIVFRWVGGRH